MNTGVIHRCIVARPRKNAPLARAVMRMLPALGQAPLAARIGVPARGGLAFGGMGPEAAP